MKLDIDYIERLTKLVAENNLTEIVLTEGDKSINIKRAGEFVERRRNVFQPQPIIQTPIIQTSENLTSEVEDKKENKSLGTPIVSPMVGTFYKAPSPESPAFVEVGDTIAVGQTVCIVEAMKLMNEIETEVSGKVTKICVEDGQPVEYGQVLMYVE